MPYFETAGARLYYEKRGPSNTSLPLIFLHDGLGSVRSWKDLPERVASLVGCSAFLYDRRGYGRSTPEASFGPGYLEKEAPIVGRFLDHLGVQAAHLAGHSDGTSIALIFAARSPRRVLSLTLVAPHTFVEEEAHAGIRELLEEVSVEEPRWLRKQHGERGQALLAAWSKIWLSEAHCGWDIRASLGRIRAPVLVVQGDRDEFATLAQVEAIRRGVPRSKVWIVAAAGHKPHIEQKSEFARRVANHIREADPVR